MHGLKIGYHHFSLTTFNKDQITPWSRSSRSLSVPMCLIPLGGGGMDNILVPPNDSTRKMSDYYKASLAMHLTMVLALFLSVDIINGIFNLILVMMGASAVRNRDGYSKFFSRVRCCIPAVDLNLSMKCLSLPPTRVLASPFNRSLVRFLPSSLTLPSIHPTPCRYLHIICA